jgi:hypothetical protein
VGSRSDTGLVEPCCDLCGIEADEVPDLEVRHPALGDQSANVSGAGAEALGELLDAEQVGEIVGCGHRGSPLSPIGGLSATLYL